MAAVKRMLGWGVVEDRSGLTLGAGIVALMACITLADHIDFALEIAEAGAAEQLPSPAWWWASPIAGAAVGWYVVRAILVATTRGAREARHLRLFVLAWLALASWLLWQWLNLDARYDDGQGAVAWPYQLAMACELAALYALLKLAPDAALSGFRQARAVRAQLLVLGLLGAVVFVVPFTAAQVEEVLRAWTDGHFITAASGVAAALLLGAVVRASTLRLANPPTKAMFAQRWSNPVRRWSLAVLMSTALLVWALNGAWLGVVVVAVAAAVIGGTRWAEPRQSGEAPHRDHVGLTRGLAGALAAVPAAILFVSLTAATIDSFLLPGAERAWHGLALTVAVGLLVAALIGQVPREPQSEALRAPAVADETARQGARVPGVRWQLAGVVIGAAAVAFVAGYGPAQVPGAAEALWASGLVAVAALVSFRIAGVRGAPELAAGWGVVIGVTVAIYAEPIEAPRAYGSFAIALTSATFVMLALHAVGSVGAAREPKRRFAVLPDRVPVVSLLGVWVLVAAVWSYEPSHQSRTTPAAGPATALPAAVDEWLDREAGAATAPVPMVLVGASGGGAKAAYWTALVVDCLLGRGIPPDGADDDHRDECARSGREGDRLDRVLLTSSVSGGSVGVFHLLDNLAEARSGDTWVRDHAGPEVLSPVAAWGLFHDLPGFLIRAKSNPTRCAGGPSCRRNADRALVQELAVAGVEDGWSSAATQAALRQPRTGAPYPVFNAALDGGGSRVLMSPLDLAPERPPRPDCPARPAPGQPAAGAFDSADVTAPDDLPVLTAALLSARFPAIAPAGRLGRTDPRPTNTGPARCSTGSRQAPVQLRDGGYMENTGLLTIVELIPQIQASVRGWNRERRRRALRAVRVPLVVVSIDDDAAVLDDDPKLTEQGRNWLGISQTAGPAYLTRSARDRLTAGQLGDVTYVRISPPPHPGARATTGWQVSPTARRHDLGAALRRGGLSESIDRLRALLDAGS